MDNQSAAAETATETAGAKRGRGRPRSFDEGEALDRATLVFWAKGYDAATLDDLVAATGVGRPSLYATFGDKEALFLRCLGHYNARVGAAVMDALHSSPGGREAVRAFLRQSVHNATGADSPPGCLMGCVAPVVADARVRAFVAGSVGGAVQAISARLAAAVSAGQLPPDFPVAARARQVVDMSMALGLRARVGSSRDALLQDVEDALAILFPPALS